jgi:hypothetical protein
MDSGVPLAPSFTVAYPMMPTQFMGMNPLVSYNGMQNFGTQSTCLGSLVILLLICLHPCNPLPGPLI